MRAGLARAFVFPRQRGLHRAAAFMAEDHEQGSLQVHGGVLQGARISGEMMLPATRTMNSSPKPASNSSSGGTRESLQPTMVA